MKLKYFILVVAGMATAGNSYAQYANDALRFSQSQYGSTSRFKAVGSAGTAVGGDLSSIGINPAGLGLFSKTEFSFTPEFVNYSASSSFLSLKTNAEKDNVTVANAGIVWVMQMHKPKGADLTKGLLSLNFGIGYNKTNDFSNKIIYSGTNPTNSIADFYSDLANNAGYGAPSGTNPPDGSLERGAYEGYLIDYFGGKYVPDTDVNNKQTKSEDRNGSQSEVNLSGGMNIGNKVFLGAGIGILSINYTSSGTFNEKGHSFGYPGEYDTDYLQNYNTTGTGINGKIGIIYKPTPFLRLGATAQTASWYNIDDSYSEMINTDLSGTTSLNVSNDRQFYDFSYKLKTPGRYNIGAALFNNNIGFISGEVEFVDYSSIMLSSRNSADEDVILANNQEISNNFKSTMNFKIGGELKASPQVMLRAGYNLLGSASDNLNSSHFKTSVYSGGAGYRFDNYYIDMAYQHVSYNTEFQPYVLNQGNVSGPAPQAAVDNGRNSVFVTFGMRF